MSGDDYDYAHPVSRSGSSQDSSWCGFGRSGWVAQGWFRHWRVFMRCWVTKIAWDGDWFTGPTAS